MNQTLWQITCPLPARRALCENLQTDVAVIGAGMAGILTAWRLQKTGLRVVVVDAAVVGSGQTAGTTAKITAQHGLFYANLARRRGMETARLYARANQQAIEDYRALIKDNRILCDFAAQNAYLYTLRHRAAIEEETRVAIALELPAAFVEKPPLPFPTEGAECFTEQAMFHPLRLLGALSEKLAVYEHSPVRRVEENTLYTDGGKIHAKAIVFACHDPFVNFPGLFFTRLHQEQVSFLALENAPRLDGMFIGDTPETVSLRQAGELLLFGGQAHRTGKNPAGGCFAKLAQQAKTLFPRARVVSHWSVQDGITPDGVPYIGNYAAAHPDWYVAAGFQKWGMTTAMVASRLLTDRILGNRNPYQSVYDPGRFAPSDLKEIAAEMKESVIGLSKTAFSIPSKNIRRLQPGQGGIVFLRGRKVGVYREGQDTYYVVSVRCRHLGCCLSFNPDERTWECPCHGSRFTARGHWLSGPAQKDIALGVYHSKNA